VLSVNERINEIGDKKTNERAKLEDGTQRTDTEIDELVYNIYCMTEEEKKTIE
jgi:hypothetical protein